jgi:4-amino-4-deoxy-L-arabinose transferase-like glycosyltransferase
MSKYIPLLKKTFLHPLLFIFLIGFALRLYQLDSYPAGFHVDEVKIGWNALSLLKTGKDDFGHPYPLHYNSFGDFRPAGYIYLAIPSIVLFGANEFAVRFPSVLIGSLTIFLLYFFVKEIVGDEDRKTAAIFSSLILALSVWHISLSRATSESLVSLILSLTGSYLLIRYLKYKQNRIFLFTSFTFFFLACFFYHVPRILNPLLAVGIVGFYWRFSKPRSKLTPLIGVFLIALFLVTIGFSLNKEARGRFSQVSVFNDLTIKRDLDLLPFEEGHSSVLTARVFHNKLVLWGTNAINEYAQYFSSAFFLTPFEAKPSRYATVGLGILTYIEFALFLIGVIAIIRGRFTYLPLLLLLIAPLPAALTTEDSPNLMRAVYMLPFVAILAGFGLVYLKELTSKFKFVFPLVIVLLTLNFVYFLHMYYLHNHQRPPIPSDRNVGAKELAIALGKIHNNYERVLVTNIPDDLHPWYGFINQLDPAEYNPYAYRRVDESWQYQNITFSKQRCPSRDAFKKNIDNILVIDAEGCEGEAKYPDSIQVLDRIQRGDKGYPYIFWHRVKFDPAELLEASESANKVN